MQNKEFFSQYKDLKKIEDWKSIILLCDSALKSNIYDLNEIVKIHNVLSTTCFYLSKTDQALDVAKKALSLCDESININSKARALYLISAAYRSKEMKVEANEYIEQALQLKDKVSDFTRAKIYFNAGALLQDLMKNSIDALKNYQLAIDLFPKGDDKNRTMLRVIRCMMERENTDIKKVQEIINETAKNIEENTKTYVHFLILNVKFCILTHNTEKGESHANKALELAKQKGMEKEFKMLNELVAAMQINISKAAESYLKY